MDYLYVAVSWLTSHIEGLYLDIEDRLYYVHILRPLPTRRLRRISDLLDDNHSENHFGFKIHELQLLLAHWRIPTTMRESRYLFNGEEAMLVYLFHIRTATPNTQMARDTLVEIQDFLLTLSEQSPTIYILISTTKSVVIQ